MRRTLGPGFTVSEPANKFLQIRELFKKSRLQDGFTQLQVKRAAGQDERRVVVEALQDVGCKEEGETVTLDCRQFLLKAYK